MVTYLVIDTSALLRITGLSTLKDFFRRHFGDALFVTTPSVVSEMKRMSSMLQFEIFREELSILDPEEKYIKYIKETVKSFGGNSLLSKTDIEILALAVQLSKLGDVVVVSEDKDIQNVALYMGFKIYSVTGEEIKHIFTTVKKCLSCGKRYSFEFESCPDCGSTRFRIERRKIKKSS